MDKRALEEALQHARDPDRLLHGEDPATNYLDDARTWENVYAELSEFKRRMLSSVEETSSQATPQAREELRSDATILGAELERLVHRHSYWRRRVTELSGAANR